ncbi:cytochrome c [Chitinophaga costaii]|uniref:Cytochrome c n=2 Tax=Chitinophaga costaii TaxID=1335309 RepID=A0A1C4FTV9_9BACT|nr:cytochrome c [Chitinophaga costaii]
MLLFMTSMAKAVTPRVLVFSRTKGWHHASIPTAIAAIQKMGANNDFIVDTTTDATRFNDDTLRQYAAVIFCNTTGNVLNGVQQAAFERYIQAGGGYAGIHAAADTEYDWPWYGKLVGAWFESHPLNPGVRRATIDVSDKTHPASQSLPDRWERSDEWYNFKSWYPGIKVLASLDENSYDGGTNGSYHPISWYHTFDGGRAFYTGGGHTEESYSEPLFLAHLLGGIRYAMGNGAPLDYTKAYAKVTPDQNRFQKTILAGNLNSPMELAIAADGRVFFTTLFGNLYCYEPRQNRTRLVYKFPVSNVGGTGLIGIGLDPQFMRNGFLYLYYAPGGQTQEPIYFRLSRFSLVNNAINVRSEKVMLKVPVQKNSGSHHGGSIAWDRAGNLYLSTGDGSNPFPSDGYAPLDERPGPAHYSLDSQRGAGNTNDFKGKILRIHPEADGTYTIPAGNLFAKGTDSTKPEIYIMGTRNPYRIALNPKTDVLYWGDIGPDAGKDSERGPRGYDEFNQARKAGNFGWPYFVANNYAYAKWDFAKNIAGPKFDEKAPVNSSPNNTGLRVLPPAMPAMIWYPYAASPEWPELGVGGRCAIVGAFYTDDPHNHHPNKFPDYYDGSLFVADWMRNWVIALRFDSQENYVRNEAFMPANGDFRRPIDMAFGPDGQLYMLEYGSVYGAANEDAHLVRIAYNRGNRPPIAKAGIVDSAAMAQNNARSFLTTDRKQVPMLRSISGQAPLQVAFSAQGSADFDDDDTITYHWNFGADSARAVYTYTKPGIYKAILKVTDQQGLSATDTLLVKVGNTAPQVKIVADNVSFYKQPFHYHVSVTDAEDKQIAPSRIKVTCEYRATPGAAYNAGDQAPAPVSFPGKSLMAASDCKSCHLLNTAAVGPDFIAIAKRYKTQKGAVEKLGAKIIHGGAGAWGTDHVMSAHPQLSTADAQEIVKYIFSLTDKPAQRAKTIPASGTLVLKYNEAEPQGQYIIAASYTDKGGRVVGPLTGSDIITLRNQDVKAVYADAYVGFPRFRDKLSQGGHKAYLLLKQVDLSHIKQLTLSYASQDGGGQVVVRLDSQAGPVLNSTSFQATGGWDTYARIAVPLTQPVSGKHDVYIYAVKNSLPNDAILRFSDVVFE